MKISESVIQRKKTVIIIWVIAFLALTPLLLNYGQYVSYSVNTKSLSNTESARAQQALAVVSPLNSSLVVVLQPSKGETVGEIGSKTIAFQEALNSSGIPYYSGSISAFTSYEKFLGKVLTSGVVSGIHYTYSNFSALAVQVYSFPSAFLGNWTLSGYSQNSISQAATKASFDGSDYESLFLNDLNQTFSTVPSSNPIERVQNATRSAALADLFDANPFLIYPAVDSAGYNVTDYRTDMLAPVAAVLTGFSGIHISTQIVQSALLAGNNASKYYVSEYSLLGAPPFVTQNYVSPDNSTYLVTVNFNVTEDFRGPNDLYPAQSATAEVRNLSQQYFGTADVTGQGAIAADTAQVSASAGYVFGLIFVFLAIAVGLLFASVLPPVLVLIVVSLATALGYDSIALAGIVFGHVDYEVTYILTAVILGVSTDYFVFIVSRYREELRAGKPNFEAISVATRKAGFAVVVSGVIVAMSLGAIALVAGLGTWGPVLAISVLITVALETTLVPAMVNLVGPRVFTIGRIRIRGRKRTPTGPTETTRPTPSVEKSTFYRAVKFSERRKFVIVGVIVLLALPSAYLWFNLPTTYNFNEGLPQGATSVQALNTVAQKFGSNVIYPTFVVVNFTQNATTSSGRLTTNATAALETDAKVLLGTSGIKQVVGPTINDTKIEPSTTDTAFVFNHGLNAYFVVFTKDDPYSTGAISLVSQLRQDRQFLVGGLTSSIIDLQGYYGAAFSQLEVLILFVIAIVLGLSFKTAKYPFIALTGVFISITWTTAILYVITQYGLGEQLIFQIPIILYVILMSLGNDFAVFILSRVREEQSSFGYEEGLA
ncbi:MAG: MMPL family transporter, partial [Nitrososphaerales archaeon]